MRIAIVMYNDDEHGDQVLRDGSMRTFQADYCLSVCLCVCVCVCVFNRYGEGPSAARRDWKSVGDRWPNHQRGGRGCAV